MPRGQDVRVLVDFDHTLFDSYLFLAAAARIATRFGCPRARFYRTFADITDGNNDAPYSFNAHARILCESTRLSKPGLSQALHGLLAQSRRFLYADSLVFLRRLRRAPASLELVSFADVAMRRSQIKYAGLGRYFDTVHICSSRDAKVERLRSLAATARFSVLVDDHPHVIRAVLRSITIATRIQRKRYRRYAHTEPQLPGVPTFRDLFETHAFLDPLLRSFVDTRPRNVQR